MVPIIWRRWRDFLTSATAAPVSIARPPAAQRKRTRLGPEPGNSCRQARSAQVAAARPYARVPRSMLNSLGIFRLQLLARSLLT